MTLRSLLVAASLAAVPVTGVHALTVDDVAFAQKALAAAMDARDGDALADVARRLEDVPGDEPLAWLARYYEGLAWLRLGELRLDDGARKAARRAFERAANRARDAITLNRGASDAHALLGAAYARQIRLSPWKKDLWGQKAGRALERALELRPDNPRAWLGKGMAAYHAAGGDDERLDRALEQLARASELFPREAEPSLPVPRWGECETWGLIATIHMDRGELDAARVALERAGFANPDSLWVTDHLQARLALLVGFEDSL